MPARKLLNYSLLHELGQGGMASVWYAENSVGRPFAIKLLKPELVAHEASVVDRFRKEAQIMVKLEHPAIRRVEDYYEDGDTLAIIMEYLDGQDLYHYIRQNGKIPEAQAVDWFKQILDAFGYVHQKGYFHRDVKPANLFLTAKGTIKVMDFGIAKIVGDDLSLTQTNSMMGSPLYMSPEQIVTPKDVDYRTDIYSLGVTLHTLLTGTKPYDDQQQSSFHIQSAIVQKPLSNLPNVSEAVNKAIQKATQKLPEDRFVDCNDFVQALTKPRASAPDADEATVLESNRFEKKKSAPPIDADEATVIQPVKVEKKTAPQPVDSDEATVLQSGPARASQPTGPPPPRQPVKTHTFEPTTSNQPKSPVAEPVIEATAKSSKSPILWIGIALGVLLLTGGAYALFFRSGTESAANPANLSPTSTRIAQNTAYTQAIQDGIGYYQNQQYDSALAIFTRHQDQPAFLNDPTAITDLGIIYYFGGSDTDAIVQDLTKARTWLQKGADLQNSKAHYFLGLLDDGVDFKTVLKARGKTNEAVEHYRKAAENGDSYAQATLGELFLEKNPIVSHDNPCTILSYLEKASRDASNPEAKGILTNFRKQNLCQQE